MLAKPETVAEALRRIDAEARAVEQNARCAHMFKGNLQLSSMVLWCLPFRFLCLCRGMGAESGNEHEESIYPIDGPPGAVIRPRGGALLPGRLFGDLRASAVSPCIATVILAHTNRAGAPPPGRTRRGLPTEGFAGDSGDKVQNLIPKTMAVRVPPIHSEGLRALKAASMEARDEARLHSPSHNTRGWSCVALSQLKSKLKNHVMPNRTQALTVVAKLLAAFYGVRLQHGCCLVLHLLGRQAMQGRCQPSRQLRVGASRSRRRWMMTSSPMQI